MADRYVAIHESKARTRKLPGYEEPADWHEDNGWALFECDDAGAPVRLVFCDRMEPEDAILVRDLRPLVAELNRLASRAPSPPETPAPEGARKPSPWMDPNHAFGPRASPAPEGSAVDPMLCNCGHPRAIHMPAWRDNVKTADSACFAPTPDGGRCCPCRKYAPASPASAPRETPVESEPKTCERCGYVGGGGWLPGWDTDPTAGTQPRGMKCPDCASPPPEAPASSSTNPDTKEQS